jgi:hypothetical protein
VTRALPFTKANLKRRIEAVHAAGLFVTAVLPDSTLLTGDRRPEAIRPFEGQDSAADKWADVKA